MLFYLFIIVYYFFYQSRRRWSVYSVIVSIIIIMVLVVSIVELVFCFVFFLQPSKRQLEHVHTQLLLLYLMLLLFLCPLWGSGNMCRAASSIWFAIQLLMSPEWLMWSDPYSRLYQRDHNSLWENLWIRMVFSAAWWIIEAALCKTAHSVCVVGMRGQERAALGLLRILTFTHSVKWSRLLSVGFF